MEEIMQAIVYDVGKYGLKKLLEDYKISFEAGNFAFEFIEIIQFKTGEGPTPIESITTLEKTLERFNFNNRTGVINYKNTEMTIMYSFYTIPIINLEEIDFTHSMYIEEEDKLLGEQLIKDINIAIYPHINQADTSTIENGLFGAFTVLKTIREEFKKLEALKENINITNDTINLKIYFDNDKALYKLLDKLRKEIPEELLPKYSPPEENIDGEKWIRFREINELFLYTLLKLLTKRKFPIPLLRRR